MTAEVADYNGTTLTDTYVYGADRGGQLETLSGGTYYLYHGDALGSVVALTNDSSGGVAASYAYGAYGAATASASLTSNPFGYTGSRFDAATGLVHDHARSYDPTTGRFLSTDPWGGAGTSTYAYAGDRPMQGRSCWNGS